MSSVGNPIGVLIALKTGLSFLDFLKWAAPIALVVDVVVYFICRWWFSAAFAEFDSAMLADAASEDPTAGAGALNDTSNSRLTMFLCWLVLVLLIGMLVTHALVEHVMHLKEGTMMVAAALAVGGVVMFISQDRARELVERRVDWWTLAFFMMLFASVGTLEDTKVTEQIAGMARDRFHSPGAMIQVIGWATGWLSAFLDNVLAVATFMPIVHDIRVAAAPQPFSSSIYWMMLFGGTFMGNMTLIGSTANIVAIGLLERRGHGAVSFWYWFKIGFIVSIASMLVATFLLIAMDWMFGVPMLPPP
jgi:Na+/H+ antiporter NhaD/arsenite permease-like protein